MEDLEYNTYVLEYNGRRTPCITSFTQEEILKIISDKGVNDLMICYPKQFSILNIPLKEVKCSS